MHFEKINSFYIFFLLLILINCKRIERAEPLVVDQLQLYNDVLDELVRNRFYYLYLGEEAMRDLRKEFDFPDGFDSLGYHRKFNKLKQEIKSDTSKQRSILLEKEFGIGFERFSKYIVSDSNKYYDDIRNSLSAISYNLRSVCDSLSLPEKGFLAKDFHSNAFKISSNEEEIGAVRFSKLVFNKDNTEAALYYEFRCDADCGMGEILILQNKDGRWVIKETHHLWIS